jgi:hypothetical protein
MNASEYMDVSMRDLINMGRWTGPRMYVVGCGLRATRSRFNVAGNPLGCGEGNGPDEFARAARQQIAAGVDWIKIFGSTGSGEPHAYARGPMATRWCACPAGSTR